MNPQSCWDRLIANPNDWEARVILAQAYERAKQSHAAECLYWQVRHHKRPYYGEPHNNFCWFNADKIIQGLGDEESDLPEALYSRLCGRQFAVPCNSKTYSTLREAEEDLHRAWGAARSEGWQPQS